MVRTYCRQISKWFMNGRRVGFEARYHLEAEDTLGISLREEHMI